MNGIHAAIGETGAPHDLWLRISREYGTGVIALAPDEWDWLVSEVERLRAEWREAHGTG